MNNVFNTYSITDLQQLIFNIECAISSLENLAKCQNNECNLYNFEMIGQYLPTISNSIQISIPLPLNLVYDNLLYLKQVYEDRLNTLYKSTKPSIKIVELNILNKSDIIKAQRKNKIKKIFK